jgi:hypothetical protein
MAFVFQDEPILRERLQSILEHCQQRTDMAREQAVRQSSLVATDLRQKANPHRDTTDPVAGASIIHDPDGPLFLAVAGQLEQVIASLKAQPPRWGEATSQVKAALELAE